MHQECLLIDEMGHGFDEQLYAINATFVAVHAPLLELRTANIEPKGVQLMGIQPNGCHQKLINKIDW